MNATVPPADVLAPVWQRAVGRGLDTLLTAIPSVGLWAALSGDGITTGELLAVTLTQIVVQFLYETVCIARWGRTLGKRTMGIRVVHVTDGRPVRWSSSAVRAAVPAGAMLVPGIGTALVFVVYLRAFFHPVRQGLHDAAAHTVVVQRA